MSANEFDILTDTAPKRIWLQANTEDADRSEPFPNEEVTWCGNSIGGAEVEYVRADIVAELVANLRFAHTVLSRLPGIGGSAQVAEMAAAIAKAGTQ